MTQIHIGPNRMTAIFILMDGSGPVEAYLYDASPVEA